MGERNWAALAEAVRRRRTALRVSQDDLAAAGGPSNFTVRRIEHGDPGPYRAKTMAQLEEALRWRPGTAQKILTSTATEAELAEVVGRETAAPAAESCACVVGSPAWIDRELATERRVNAIAQVFQGEVQRLLAVVEAVRRG